MRRVSSTFLVVGALICLTTALAAIAAEDVTPSKVELSVKAARRVTALPGQKTAGTTFAEIPIEIVVENGDEMNGFSQSAFNLIVLGPDGKQVAKQFVRWDGPPKNIRDLRPLNPGELVKTDRTIQFHTKPVEIGKDYVILVSAFGRLAGQVVTFESPDVQLQAN
ncbi:hypothetical protein Pan216_31940 [Planctomycetes bacterium Pan216]|uniref:Uncharacterized protein n=1 Tax=Kolteria novifilia TaxID=2527975 RepID=A0A518B5S2_9BACT|nr:hypothetical protein Pan216_31940 [Planctomycetes bacterium Pan216]